MCEEVKQEIFPKLVVHLKNQLCKEDKTRSDFVRGTALRASSALDGRS